MIHDELVQHLSTIADWGYLYSYIIGSRRGRRFATPRKVRRAICGPPTARSPSLSWRRPLSSRFALFAWRRGAGVGRHGHHHLHWRDFCCHHADCLGSHNVERCDVEPGHVWSRQRGNRLRDDHWFDSFTDALIVTGVAYVQGAVTLGNEATDMTAIAGRHDLLRWRRNPSLARSLWVLRPRTLSRFLGRPP